MTAFFLPFATDDEVAEQTWQAIKKFAEDGLKWRVADHRIYRLAFNNKGTPAVAVVGEPDPITGEPIVAILQSNAYLICTPTRGVVRDMPVLVGTHEVTSVELFDEGVKHRYPRDTSAPVPT